MPPLPPGWKLADDGKSIAREFTFAGFRESLVFINRVGELAEADQHHPDIHCWWNKVKLELTTHDSGGLSDKDFKLAAKINQIN